MDEIIKKLLERTSKVLAKTLKIEQKTLQLDNSKRTQCLLKTQH